MLICLKRPPRPCFSRRFARSGRLLASDLQDEGFGCGAVSYAGAQRQGMNGKTTVLQPRSRSRATLGQDHGSVHCQRVACETLCIIRVRCHKAGHAVLNGLVRRRRESLGMEEHGVGAKWTQTGIERKIPAIGQPQRLNLPPEDPGQFRMGQQVVPGTIPGKEPSSHGQEVSFTFKTATVRQGPHSVASHEKEIGYRFAFRSSREISETTDDERVAPYKSAARCPCKRWQAGSGLQEIHLNLQLVAQEPVQTTPLHRHRRRVRPCRRHIMEGWAHKDSHGWTLRKKPVSRNRSGAFNETVPQHFRPGVSSWPRRWP